MQRNTDFHFTPAAREKLATLLPDNAAAIDMLERRCARYKKHEQDFEDEPSIDSIRIALRPFHRALARVFDTLDEMPDCGKEMLEEWYWGADSDGRHDLENLKGEVDIWMGMRFRKGPSLRTRRVRRSLDGDVARILVRHGVRVSTYRDGTLAKVLLIILNAVGYSIEGISQNSLSAAVAGTQKTTRRQRVEVAQE